MNANVSVFFDARSPSPGALRLRRPKGSYLVTLSEEPHLLGNALVFFSPERLVELRALIDAWLLEEGRRTEASRV
jgi:hypothetical protein